MKILFAGHSSLSNSRGQLKIQQMAFVLVAMIIFFAIALLFYFSIRYNSLRGDVEDLRRQEVLETVRKISSTPEFSWNEEDCSACIDLDKVLMLKNRTSYKGFWKNIALLRIERVYPSYDGNGGECTAGNYPECNTITIINEEGNFQGHRAFVSLCRYDSNGYTKCELGKVVMAFESVG